jgi:hypothetical protein
MRLSHQGRFLLGAGLVGLAVAGCQGSNEAEFIKNAPAARQAGTGKEAPAASPEDYYKRMQQSQGKMFQKVPGYNASKAPSKPSTSASPDQAAPK